MQLKFLVALMGMLLLVYGCSPVDESDKPEDKTLQAAFLWFEYQGYDEVFSNPIAEDEYRNPVIAGFYPDPSITRAGNDFYLINSSFSYFPGIPLFHSTDLVNWRPLGHVLTRPEQLQLDGLGMSRGIYAPTIRYHDGTFYVISTAVESGGNFLVTASDPEGPWSDPIWLPEIEGIDPDIFFDDDGRVYIAHNGAPEGEPLYDGHRAIWLWEYDPENQAVVKDSGRVVVDGGTDITKQPIWIEGPHIFRRDGWYYLSCAEGGTGYEHSQVIFRTKSLSEPFVPYENNPILTQRDLERSRDNPVIAAGHADMVQTPNGDWWAVFLASRAYDETFVNTGRETFLLPVNWENGWPHILPAKTAIPYVAKAPKGLPKTTTSEPVTGNFTWRDDFDGNDLSPLWSLLRTGNRDWSSLDEKPGALVLTPSATTLADLQQPSFLARRQQHLSFTAETALELPLTGGLSAGLVAFQNSTHHFYLGAMYNGASYTLFLESAQGGTPAVIESTALPGNIEQLKLGIEGRIGTISFYYVADDKERKYLASELDAKILSTQVAGGFVGAHVGVHTRRESAQQ